MPRDVDMDSEGARLSMSCRPEEHKELSKTRFYTGTQAQIVIQDVVSIV